VVGVGSNSVDENGKGAAKAEGVEGGILVLLRRLPVLDLVLLVDAGASEVMRAERRSGR
jgi:hypothetical protein